MTTTKIDRAGVAALLSIALTAGCATGSSKTPDGGELDTKDPLTDVRITPDAGEPCPSGGCDDGKACTEDSCVKGLCRYEVKAGFCLIDGACHADGAKDGECHVCRAAQSPNGWTEEASLCADDGKGCTEASCHAGQCEQRVKDGHCLVGQSCLKDGETPTGEECRVCESTSSQTALSPRADGTACASDSVDCTDDICQSGQCKHPLKTNSCLISGKCYQAGDVQPGSECSTCQPSKSTSTWSSAPDNTPCSSDSLSCTDDLCKAGQCKHPTKSSFCLIKGSCYADGAADPQNECLACNPLMAQDVFSAKANGQPCSADALSCTDDTCQNGNCTHLLSPTSCLIGGACYSSGASNPFSQCQVCDPVQHAGTWTQKQAGESCSADALSCTDDVCNAQGTCIHPLKSGHCLVNGSCYASGTPSPGDSCKTCQPGTSTAVFTPAVDGTLCATDNLPCTNDVCRVGVCQHELAADRCIINGGCYSVDAVVDSTGCNICAPSVSTSAATFATGKACSDGDSSTGLDACLAGSCKGFSGYRFELDPSDTSTALHDVATFSDGATWLVGERNELGGATTGLIARIGATNLTDVSTGGGALYAVSERMAVGAGGATAYWNGSSWYIASQVMTHVGTAQLEGVFGVTISGTRTYYIAGGSGTLSRCSTGDNGISFSCQSVGGLAATTGLADISGVTTSSTIGPLWAVRGETAEDIYHSANGSSWSTSGPAGCADSGANPCAGTSGRLLSVWARTASDVWAVGEQGLVLRYDGSSWSKITIPSLGTQNPQSSMTLRSVSGHGDVVAIVGEQIWSATDRDLFVIYYNRTLNRWYTPQVGLSVLVTDPHATSYRFNGIGLDTSGEPVIVGQSWDTTRNEQVGIYFRR
ncbi:MAG: hypothetical protein CSA65_06795 [Proteobacteria bacterium]|nr:MAG: hypothetical protein CSA65_06795 [Pseudomonadota bacterium]